MVSPFVAVINKLWEIGAFQFLFPYMLTSAIFYGLLRKTKIFGDPEKNVAVNGVVALIAAFMVWAYPVIAGVDISVQLSTFFFQGMVALLAIVVILLAIGMFLPENLPEQIGKRIGGRGIGLIVIAGIILGGIIVVTSGLIGFFFPAGLPGIPEDIVTIVAVIIILLIPIFIMMIPSKEAPKAG
jgi:hypothetical protein